MKAAVVGLGQFGYAAALALSRAGVEVIAIDNDMRHVESIQDEVALAVCTDGTKQENLEAQGVSQVDFLIAGIGVDFEAQILLIVAARELGVARIIARSASLTHSRVLKAVGASEVVTPEKEAAQSIVLRLLSPASGKPVRLTDDLSFIELPAPEGLVGRTLRDESLDLTDQHGVCLVAVRRKEEGGTRAILTRETRIESGDSLVLAGEESALLKVAHSFSPAKED